MFLNIGIHAERNAFVVSTLLLVVVSHCFVSCRPSEENLPKTLIGNSISSVEEKFGVVPTITQAIHYGATPKYVDEVEEAGGILYFADFHSVKKEMLHLRVEFDQRSGRIYDAFYVELVNSPYLERGGDPF